MSASTEAEPAEERSFGAFREGMRDGLPVIVAVLPFGLLFGALAVENGLCIAEAVLMSATVYGGASQMVGIELFGQKIAPWLIVLSIFAVNFRHVLYSAAVGRRIDALALPAQRGSASSCSSIRNCRNRAPGGARASRLTFAWYLGLGAADLCELGRRDLDRRRISAA